uniref:Uncharacterized protein n=1 Tax=Glossina pallidipes TaxID=7398 RepID=A0A1A9ZJ66_GLOPL
MEMCGSRINATALGNANNIGITTLTIFLVASCQVGKLKVTVGGITGSLEISNLNFTQKRLSNLKGQACSLQYPLEYLPKVHYSHHLTPSCDGVNNIGILKIEMKSSKGLLKTELYRDGLKERDLATKINRSGRNFQNVLKTSMCSVHKHSLTR